MFDASNTMTYFITKLSNSLFLEGDWEVGLAETEHPYTWNSIRSGENN